MGRREKQDKLAQEAVAATNAGMSYGKWKALQGSKNEPPARPKKAKTPVPGSRPVCRICGKEIPEFTRRRTFCSQECAKKGADEKYRI